MYRTLQALFVALVALIALLGALPLGCVALENDPAMISVAFHSGVPSSFAGQVPPTLYSFSPDGSFERATETELSNPLQKRVLAAEEDLAPLQTAFRERLAYHQQTRAEDRAAKGSLRRLLKHVAEDVFQSEAYAQLDPHLHDHHKLDVQVFRFGGVFLASATPTLQGYPVEDAPRHMLFDQERVVHINFGHPLRAIQGVRFEPLDRVLELARQHSELAASMRADDPTASRVWLSSVSRRGALLPAYRLRAGPVHDVWLHAQSGQLLRQRMLPVPQQDNTARVFSSTYPPSDPSTLETVQLVNVYAGNDQYLSGMRVQPCSGCVSYQCDSPPCTLDEASCRTPLDEPGNTAVPLVTGTFNLTLMFGHRYDWEELGFVDALAYFATDVQVLLPSAERLADGFVEYEPDERDPERLGEPFAQVNAYHHMDLFLDHVRDVLGDQTFCLRRQAMLCEADGSPEVTDEGRPRRPFRVGTNLLWPDSDPEPILKAARRSQGTSPANPILLSQVEITNAFYIPSGYAPPAPGTYDPAAEPVSSLFDQRGDVLGFVQKSHDPAYDQSVVYHEWVHALTNTLTSALTNYGLDRWGGHQMGGSLSEGWSDYFAASFVGDSRIGVYFFPPTLRNLDNNNIYPNFMAGFRHTDSVIFSGTLWQIRATLAGNSAHVNALDRLFLLAVAQAEAQETFELQRERIMNAIETFGPTELGQAVSTQLLSDAARIFDERGIGMPGTSTPRVADSLNVNRVFSPSFIGVANGNPSLWQKRILISDPDVSSLTMKWQQTSLLPGLVGYTAFPRSLLTVVSDGCPLFWTIAPNAQAVDELFVGKCGSVDSVWSVVPAVSDNNKQDYDASVTIPLPPYNETAGGGPISVTNPRQIFVSFVNVDSRFSEITLHASASMITCSVISFVIAMTVAVVLL